MKITRRGLSRMALIVLVLCATAGGIFFLLPGEVAAAFLMGGLGAGLAVSLYVSSSKSARMESLSDDIMHNAGMGLAHLIDLQFDEQQKGALGRLNVSLNHMLLEMKRVFWVIKENLFETKINNTTLENMKLIMVTYIQKVVNIGNVRDELAGICGKIDSATKSTKEILGLIVELADKTDKEASAVKQASEAISSLLSHISKITEITHREQEMAKDLQEVTAQGGIRVKKTNEIIERLYNSTDEMLRIIEIINGVTETTNILSINAGIEAAHAGSQGNGFRIISSEIKKLVERSKGNSDEIGILLREQVLAITEALDESSLSGKVFARVSQEVEDATFTWNELSRSTEDMSQGISTIKDATGRMFQITEEVKDASSAIRSSVERVNRENEELEVTSRKTLDVLERVTVTNAEAQSSTMEVLQQLNEMSKFVRDLNKSIDFINLGKKIFCLSTPGPNHDWIVQNVIRKEFEIYTLDRYSLISSLAREFPSALFLLDFIHPPVDITLEEIQKKLKAFPGVRVGIVCPENFKAPREDSFPGFSFLPLNPEQKDKTLAVLLKFIRDNKARGLRKYIRVECAKDKETFVSVNLDENREADLLDICSVSLACDFGTEIPLDEGPVNFSLKLEGTRIQGKANKVVHKEKGVYIFFFDFEDDNFKTIIYDFIFRRLQKDMKKVIGSL